MEGGGWVGGGAHVSCSVTIELEEGKKKGREASFHRKSYSTVLSRLTIVQKLILYFISKVFFLAIKTSMPMNYGMGPQFWVEFEFMEIQRILLVTNLHHCGPRL